MLSKLGGESAKLADEVQVVDFRALFSSEPANVATSPRVSGEVKTTTCYMCACRCGIRVHLDGGRVRYIDGNPDHPVNRGVLCAKGAAGIMQHRSPARLSAPLLRIGERGEGRFKEISWDEALTVASGWLDAARKSDPRKLAFFTGRDQSQALTGWWAKQFGTPNYAAHGGFCSVNMAAAGFYSIGSSFWEFGEPDWDHTRYLMLFGVCEDHSSNPLKIGLGRLKSRGQAKIVSVNPVCTGYSAIADEWLGLRPGTDGLLVLALIHELLRAERVDAEYLVRYTNAPWLVIDDPGGAEDGLFARDQAGHPLAFDTKRGQLVDAHDADIVPALVGEWLLPDGRRARPAFELMATRYLSPDYAPEAVAPTLGIEAATIRRIAREIAEVAFEQEVVLPIAWTDWAGRHHDRIVGRPISFHAMRGIAAHSNGFQTCRALHVLQMLLGSIDVPGGFLAKPSCPRPSPPGRRPGGQHVRPGEPLDEMPLGWVVSPDDLLVDAAGKPTRIDRAFSWEHPLAAHGALHLALRGAWSGDPYPIDVLFLYMANMGWNSAMNLRDTHGYFTDKSADGRYRIPHVIYSDAYHSEMVAYADLVLPDTTYLERWDCLSLLDRPISSGHGPADGVRRPVVACDRDVRPFQDVLLDLGARLALPGMVDERGLPRYAGGYPDFIVRHERSPGIGLLAVRAAPARALCREWLLLAGRAAARGALFEARQQGLSRVRPALWLAGIGGTDHLSALSRALAALPSGGARPRPTPATTELVRAHRALFRSAADLVSTAFGRAYRSGALSPARHYAAADARVSRLGFAERLAASDRDAQLALHSPRHGDRARPRRPGLGLDQLASWPRQGAGQDHARHEPTYGLDVERDRQARRYLGPRSGRARSARRLPAQSPDTGHARQRRHDRDQRRSDHRPGRVVRPPRQPRKMRAP